MKFWKEEPVILLSKLKENYKEDICTFMSIFIFGVIVHLFVLTNKFFNYFEMGNILADMSYAQNDTLGLGRWFLPVATNLFTSFSIPLLNGIICISYMGLAAVMLLKLVRIEKMFLRILFGAVWITFPGMASVFSYGVNSDVFCFCIFTAVLAIFLEEKCKYGFWLGSIVLAVSIGAYQPFLSIAIGTAYCILFRLAISENFKWQEFLKKALRLLGMLLLGFVLYYLLLQVILTITGMTLSNYHGIDNMISFTPKGVAKGFVYSYAYFLKYLFSINYIYTWGRIIWNIIGAMAFLFLIVSDVCIYKQCGQKIWILILLCFLPLGLNASPFLMGDRVGNGVDRYMLFSIMLLWLLAIMFIENYRKKNYGVENNLVKSARWLVIISTCITAISGSVICNEAYYRMDAMTTATESLMTRIVQRIEQQPEWKADMPIYFVNPKQLFNDNYQVEIYELEGLKNLPGTEIKPWYNEKALVKYINVYLHFPVHAADDEVKKKLEESEEFGEMGIFPSRDSVKIINGVVVVRISNDED